MVGAASSLVGFAQQMAIRQHGLMKDADNGGYFTKGRAKGALWAHAVNPFVTWANNWGNLAATMMGHTPMRRGGSGSHRRAQAAL